MNRRKFIGGLLGLFGASAVPVPEGKPEPVKKPEPVVFRCDVTGVTAFTSNDVLALKGRTFFLRGKDAAPEVRNNFYYTST